MAVRAAFVLAAALLAVTASATRACAEEAASPPPADPMQGFNRRIFGANQVLDRHVMRPLAKGYVAVTPRPVRTGVRHVLLNVTSADVFVNDLLQLHPKRAGITLTRFALNTTAGLGGVIDVGRGVGLKGHDADFGQTLGYWGVGAGPHLELPILGPSDLRDGLALGVDGLLDPLSRISGSTGQAVRAGAGGVGFMDRRAQLIPLTDRLSRKPDYYVALRDHYASHRAALVRAARRGGEPAPPIDQDDDEPGPSPTAAVAAGS